MARTGETMALESRPAHLTLYHYWRSSSSWRVRWAFAHKGIACEHVGVDLLNGESESAEHRARNPFGYVPALEIRARSDSPSHWLTESLAIIEWAEELWPEPRLLPRTALERAHARQLAETVNAGTQPLQNLGTQALHSEDPALRKSWAQYWIRTGLEAYERIACSTAGRFSVGDELSLADLCLIPQCYNARRFDIDPADYPTIARIEAEALRTPSCQASDPVRFQPESFRQ